MLWFILSDPFNIVETKVVRITKTKKFNKKILSIASSKIEIINMFEIFYLIFWLILFFFLKSIQFSWIFLQYIFPWYILNGYIFILLLCCIFWLIENLNNWDNKWKKPQFHLFLRKKEYFTSPELQICTKIQKMKNGAKF